MQRLAVNFSKIGAIAFFVLCSDIKRPPVYTLLLAIPGSGNGKVGAVTTDFGAAGRFGVLNPDTLVVTPGISNIHSDALSKYMDGKVYVINRLNRDNIQVLNPLAGYATELEFSTDSGSNPQDIVKVNSDKAYVSRYNRNSLLIVNPSSGTQTGAINLQQFAESNSSGSAGPDGLPEMNQMYLEKDALFVQIQRLDRNDPSGKFVPNASSLLIEIDTKTDKVVASYPFRSRNPVGKIQRIEIFGAPHLVMPVPNRLGFLSANDGGVEAFNLNTRTFRNEFLYSETTAGGDIMDVQIKNESEGYAFVSDSSFNKYIQYFNPSTGGKISVLAEYPASAGNVSGILLGTDKKLYVGDASFSKPGIMIYDTERGNTRVTPVPVDAGLRPFDLIWIP